MATLYAYEAGNGSITTQMLGTPDQPLRAVYLCGTSYQIGTIHAETVSYCNELSESSLTQ